MSKWLPTPAILPDVTFDGDTIKATAKRLKIADMSALVGKKFNLDTEEGRLGVTQLGADILPRYIATLDGLTDANGGQITKEVYFENIEDFYFAPLTAGLLFGLLSASSVRDELPK